MCFDLAGLEPVIQQLSLVRFLLSVFPITPSVEINRLYSGNLKPQITVMSLILKGVVLLVVIEAHEK